MGMSVVARYVDRTEAEIAASALRSAGFNAVAMDTNFSAIDWMAMQALGGIRVGVPDDELDEAASFLGELIHKRPEPGPEPHPGSLWRTAAIACGVIIPILALTMLEPRTWWQTCILIIGLIGTPLAWIIVGAVKSRNRQPQSLAIASASLLVLGAIVLALVVTAIIHPDALPLTFAS